MVPRASEWCAVAHRRSVWTWMNRCQFISFLLMCCIDEISNGMCCWMVLVSLTFNRQATALDKLQAINGLMVVVICFWTMSKSSMRWSVSLVAFADMNEVVDENGPQRCRSTADICRPELVGTCECKWNSWCFIIPSMKRLPDTSMVSALASNKIII